MSSHIMNGRSSGGSEGMQQMLTALEAISKEDLHQTWIRVRELKEYTQKMAANELDIKLGRLSAYETGRTRWMESRVMNRLVEKLAWWCDDLSYHPVPFPRSGAGTATTSNKRSTKRGASQSRQTYGDSAANLRYQILALCPNPEHRLVLQEQIEPCTIPELAALFLAMKTPA